MSAKLTIKNLKERWETPEGQLVLTDTLSALRSKTPLDQVRGLESVDGKIDLRGISFPKERKYWLSKKQKLMDVVIVSSKFKKVVFADVDFSYADIEGVEFERCKFLNCTFYQVNARQIRCYDCEFENVIFKNTRLSYSQLNKRKWYSSGSFRNLQFIKSQLNEVSLDFPVIDNCLFEDCNLHAANFDGSRFTNCKFVGLVDSPWFRKYSIFGYSPIFLPKNKNRYSNEMRDVDLSQAILKNVCFTDDLDLSLCQFPPNIKKEQFESRWSGYCISSAIDQT